MKSNAQQKSSKQKNILGVAVVVSALAFVARVDLSSTRFH